MKKKVIAIAAIMVVFLAVAIAIAAAIENLYKENNVMLSRLRMVENERNALSDAIRCYADSKDTAILSYSSWYLNAVGCPDSLEDWANIY